MSVIQYNLPTMTAEETARKAIITLEAVESLGGDSLFYCIQPSNVLALAGLRALSPYNEFNPSFSGVNVEALNTVLREHDCVSLIQDEYGSDPAKRLFSIVNNQALQRTTEHYPLVAKAIPKPPHCPTWSAYTQWTTGMWVYIAEAIHEGELPKRWLQNWFTPHEIHFGMMLGYPGLAIADMCEYQAVTQEESSAPAPIDMIIDQSNLFDGTEVSYLVYKKHALHPEITAHKRLWQDTLSIVYRTFSTKRLYENNALTKEFEEYKSYQNLE